MRARNASASRNWLSPSESLLLGSYTDAETRALRICARESVDDFRCASGRSSVEGANASEASDEVDEGANSVMCLLCRDFGFTTAVTCDCAPGIVAIVEEGGGEGACVGVGAGGGSGTVLR